MGSQQKLGEIYPQRGKGTNVFVKTLGGLFLGNNVMIHSSV